MHPAGQVGFAVLEEQESAFFIGQEPAFEQVPEEVSVRLHANPKIAIQARRGRRRIIQDSFVLSTREGIRKKDTCPSALGTNAQEQSFDVSTVGGW